MLADARCHPTLPAVARGRARLSCDPSADASASIASFAQGRSAWFCAAERSLPGIVQMLEPA